MQCIHHKLKSQISYDNVLLLSIVIHRKVFPSWMHLSYILGPRFVRTKFSPQKNRIGRHPPLGYFIAQHLPPLQSWSRPATCWPEKYPPSGGKPHAHLWSEEKTFVPEEKSAPFLSRFILSTSVIFRSTSRKVIWNHKIHECLKCFSCIFQY